MEEQIIWDGIYDTAIAKWDGDRLAVMKTAKKTGEHTVFIFSPKEAVKLMRFINKYCGGKYE